MTGPVFRIDPWTHRLGGIVEATRGFWIWLGELESSHLQERLEAVTVDRPLYVSGLARAGTTLLLELLASHPDTATHRYEDFPSVYTPVLWSRYLRRMSAPATASVERAQRDGIRVTAASPEAMEEMVWMAFFPDAHEPAVSQVLDASTSHPRFEAFYRNHVRKLVFVRRAQRYLAKSNYDLTRVDYLLRLFPDARFVIPVRHPVTHVGSLMRQDELFARGVAEEPRAGAHLRRIGHFEFGADFRPVNPGNDEAIRQILAWRQAGQSVRAWARYWSVIHDFVVRRLAASPELRRASLLVRFEDLCDRPRETLAAVLRHCELDRGDELAAAFAPRVRAPDYYAPDFSPADLAAIREETHRTAARLGYPD